ncbi:hypothetical protein [Ammoniphilus sp. CFH 90114]|uniref:hypothetical protein n=1 Tax=Ammoniphilus sp. CFH 90114 TaxID=2493665 RepID=UPI00100E6FBE|nr:hypothetical protein [Ammoniphilus sp. CFH 90114]RXT06988.1 hypothetical protein EIZ39_12580 [Ammoniphilus sp. CFH 90114]
MRNTNILNILVGVLAILTGFLYVLRLFGPTESEVVSWRLLAVVIGGIVVFLGRIETKVTNFLQGAFVCFLVFIQVPPIFLWFAFHGSGISDGTPPSNFVAHWIFATPHIAIALLGIIVIVSLFKKNTTRASS